MSRMAWQPLQGELAVWRAYGHMPRLWLRDDDASEPTGLLDQLIALANHHEVPLVLAIIPAKTGPALARRLESERHVLPVVHGWSHANHAPPSEKRQELGLHRDLGVILDDCGRGLARLSQLYGKQLVPMMVPPWNRIALEVAERLPELGYRALSGFGRNKMRIGGLTIVNTHVDLIDSRGTRRCHEPEVLIARIAAELKAARETGETHCGLLSHHLAGDPAQFAFLQALFAQTAGLWVSPLAE